MKKTKSKNEILREIKNLREEYGRIDNGTQCEKQRYISEKIGKLKKLIKD